MIALTTAVGEACIVIGLILVGGSFYLESLREKLLKLISNTASITILHRMQVNINILRVIGIISTIGGVFTAWR